MIGHVISGILLGVGVVTYSYFVAYWVARGFKRGWYDGVEVKEVTEMSVSLPKDLIDKLQ